MGAWGEVCSAGFGLSPEGGPHDVSARLGRGKLVLLGYFVRMSWDVAWPVMSDLGEAVSCFRFWEEVVAQAGLNMLSARR